MGSPDAVAAADSAAEDEVGLCGLCESSGPLRNGHLVPRFVVRWVKETSATGLLLAPATEGRPQQDARTRRLFCSACEQLLSRDEKAFAEHVFIPRHEQEEAWRGFDYEAWLSRFQAGLLLKAALEEDAPEWARRKLERAVVPELRAFLLDRTAWPRPYEMHLVFTDYLPYEQLPPDTSKSIQWYLMRAGDLTVAFSSVRTLMLYASIPGFQFWMPVQPVRQPDWAGTKVSLRGSFVQPTNQSMGVPGWLEFVGSRADGVSERTAGTPNQRAARAARLLRNAERAQASRSLEAFLASPPRE